MALIKLKLISFTIILIIFIIQLIFIILIINFIIFVILLIIVIILIVILISSFHFHHLPNFIFIFLLILVCIYLIIMNFIIFLIIKSQIKKFKFYLKIFLNELLIMMLINCMTSMIMMELFYLLLKS